MNCFRGATCEGHSLIPVITALQARYALEKVVFVADRGLFSEDNLSFLEAQNLTYVVGARIKNLPAALTREVLNSAHYHDLELADIGNDEVYKVAQFTHQERRLVVSFSQRRARKDREDRNKILQKLRNKLNRSGDVKNFVDHTKKYLNQSGAASLVLDEEKIRAAENFDGLAGISPTRLNQWRPCWRITMVYGISKRPSASLNMI